MLNPGLLRDDPDGVFKKLARRGGTYDKAAWLMLEKQRKALQIEVEGMQGEVKEKSREIGVLKREGGDDAPLLREVEGLKKRLEKKSEQFSGVRAELDHFLLNLPNLPDDSVPDGAADGDNVEIRRSGEKPEFDFEPLDHVEIGGKSGLFDTPAAAKMSGARFAVFYGELARLHRALIQLMLDMHIGEHGYTEACLPYIVNAEALVGSGQLPKFEDDLFRLSSEPPRYLIPTAEVPLVNLCRDTIISADGLPLKWVAHTPCFRSEAGAYGKDTRGLIRQHQFEKVELVQVVAAEHSWEALDRVTAHAEAVLQRLGLAYRVVSLCAGDLGFAAAGTYDLETWMPGQGRFREISSCSNTLDFQARRIRARVRNAAGKLVFVHTLNGSGLAVGRTMAALMENYQTADGRIRIPEALRPYMGGRELI